MDRRQLLCGATALITSSVWARPSRAATLGTLRLGVLAFGTVRWELDVIQHHGLDAAHGFTLDVQGFGGGQASEVALQGGAVDGIVSDWLWVSRQRASDRPHVFIPYSATVGALMVPGDSGIAGLADLSGKRLGIAGGPLDKSWLILQGYAQQKHDIDLAATVEPVFAAPPLLNQQALTGGIDAVLNYWHFCARLEAQGFNRLLSVDEATRGMAVEGQVIQLGYVFPERLADEQPELLRAFAAASQDAKALLRQDEAEWQRIAPLMKAEDEATFTALQRRYREGIPQAWGEKERRAAAQLYQVLAELGGRDLVGDAPSLADGTFWSGVAF